MNISKHNSALIVMFILAMNIFFVLWEFLKIEPYIFHFEAPPLFFYMGDFLFKNNPHYSTWIFDA